MLQLQFLNLSKGPLWLVDPKYTIGASSEHSIRVSHGADYQADLIVEPNRVSLSNIADFRTIIVNGQSLSASSSTGLELKHDDEFRMGGLEFKLVDPKLNEKTELLNGRSTFPNDRAWSIKGISLALTSKEFVLKDVGVIGRSKSCDISLVATHLSRQHAKYTVGPLGVKIEDLNSSNGTFVNGHRVNQALLKNGDELSFDALVFRVNGPELETLSDDDADKTVIRPAIRNYDVVANPRIDGYSGVSRPAMPRKKVKSLAAQNVSEHAQLPEGVVPFQAKPKIEKVEAERQRSISTKIKVGIVSLLVVFIVGACFAFL